MCWFAQLTLSNCNLFDDEFCSPNFGRPPTQVLKTLWTSIATHKEEHAISLKIAASQTIAWSHISLVCAQPIAASDLGSITKEDLTLHRSTAVTTRSLLEMEKQLGIFLFDRTRQSPTLIAPELRVGTTRADAIQG